ncbi:MAG: hypothetical protein ACE5PV_20130 [Candidatus Poribacteria bacterium]
MRASRFVIWLLVALTVSFVISSVSIAQGAKRFSKHPGWMYVDLKPYANAPLEGNDAWHGNAGTNDLRNLPRGEIEAEGPDGKKVPFYIIEPKDPQKDPVCMMGKGQNGGGPGYPDKIEGIKVGVACEEIYFLQASGWENPGNVTFSFVMHYADGKKEKLDFIGHLNTDDWWHFGAALGDKDNAVWGIGPLKNPNTANIGFVNTRWKNPRPGVVIKSLDFISPGDSGAVPGVIGITLGGARPVQPTGKLTTTWGSIKN